jgi:hypothetical protein
MQQKISKTECGFMVTDTIEDLNPNLTKKAEGNTNGLIQLLEIEGVELRFDQTVRDKANLTSVCTKLFEKDCLTDEDLKQLHESHDRIIETISMWSLKRQSKIKSLDPKPQKEATPYELFCEFMDDENRSEMSGKEIQDAIAKALGFNPSGLITRILVTRMTEAYVRSKENQKKL